MGAIYILWLRELKRYVRSRVQIVVSLGQPCLYLLALGFGLGPVFQQAGHLTDIIRRGQKRGILRSGIDLEVGIALLLGPLMYQHILGYKPGRRAPRDLEIQVADAFLAAFGTGKRATDAKSSDRA
jgi:hypothetical protein